MPIVLLRQRLFPGAIYLVLILGPCALIAFFQVMPGLAVTGAMYLMALPLFATRWLDHLLLGGGGFHSLSVFVLFALVWAALFWPLPVLAIQPRLWQKARWKKGMVIYAWILALCMVGAGIAMTWCFGLFLG